MHINRSANAGWYSYIAICTCSPLNFLIQYITMNYRDWPITVCLHSKTAHYRGVRYNAKHYPPLYQTHATRDGVQGLYSSDIR